MCSSQDKKFTRDISLRVRKSLAELLTLSAQMIGLLSQDKSGRSIDVLQVRADGPRLIYESLTNRMA